MPNLARLVRRSAAVAAPLAGFVMLAAPTEKALADKPSTPVTVTNPETGPALTSSVDDPGRIPYQLQHGFVSSECNVAFHCLFFPPAVPAGKRLVIQRVGVLADLSPGSTAVSLTIFNNNGFLSGFVVPVTQANVPGPGALVEQATQFYVDGGGSVSVAALAEGAFLANNGSVGLFVTFTGYLVDCAVNQCVAIAP